MPSHILGVVVALQYFAFWWGATLIYCGIGEIDEGAGLAAVGLGFLLLIAGVVTITILGDETQRLAFPLTIALMAALPGIWTGLRSWKALKLTAAKKNKKTKAVPHD